MGRRALVVGMLLAVGAILVTRLVTIVYFAPRLEATGDLGGLGLASLFLVWLFIIGRTLVASISPDATLQLDGLPTARSLDNQLDHRPSTCWIVGTDSLTPTDSPGR